VLCVFVEILAKLLCKFLHHVLLHIVRACVAVTKGTFVMILMCEPSCVVQGKPHCLRFVKHCKVVNVVEVLLQLFLLLPLSSIHALTSLSIIPIYYGYFLRLCRRLGNRFTAPSLSFFFCQKFNKLPPLCCRQFILSLQGAFC
jgi:hypothetical protein